MAIPTGDPDLARCTGDPDLARCKAEQFLKRRNPNALSTLFWRFEYPRRNPGTTAGYKIRLA